MKKISGVITKRLSNVSSPQSYVYAAVLRSGNLENILGIPFGAEDIL